MPAFVSRICRPLVSWTASARFCLLQSMPSASCGSPGRSSFVCAASASRAAVFAFSAPAGSARRSFSVACASPAAEPLGGLRARDAEPDRLLAAGRDDDVVAELAARAVAVVGVVAAVGLVGRVRPRRRADHGPGRVLLRAAEAGAGLRRVGRVGGDVRADGGGPVVLGRAGQRRRAVLGEHERVAVGARGRLVGQVEGRLVERLAVGGRLAPGVGRHELRVGLHGQVEGLLGAGGREVQADEHAAGLPGHEVGALDAQPGLAGQRHLHVAVAARELRRRSDPRAVEAEPDAVEQLHGRRPDAAHLAARMEAGRRIPARLRPDVVRPRTRGDEAPRIEAVGGGQLVCRSRRDGGSEQRERREDDDRDPEHGPAAAPRARAGIIDRRRCGPACSSPNTVSGRPRSAAGGACRDARRRGTRRSAWVRCAFRPRVGRNSHHIGPPRRSPAIPAARRRARRRAPRAPRGTARAAGARRPRRSARRPTTRAAPRC